MRLTVVREWRSVELVDLVLVGAVTASTVDTVAVPTTQLNVLVEEIQHRGELREKQDLRYGVMTSDQSGCTAEQSYRENERSPCACAGTAPAKRDRAASSCQTGSQCLQGRRSGLDHRTSAAGGSQSAADSSSPSSTSSFCARDSLGRGRGRYGQFTTDERLRQRHQSSDLLAVCACAVALASARCCSSSASCSCRLCNCLSNSSSSAASGSAST